jgi:hypothetical protein
VLAVDQRRVSGRRPLDVGACVVGAPVEGYRDRREAALTQLVVQCLPDRQVLAAPSPGCPGDEEDLPPALIAERMEPAVEVGEGEVRRLHRGQAVGAVGGRRTEHGDPLGRIHREGPVQQPREGGQVEAVRVDQRRPVADRDARLVPAQPLGLQLPAERARDGGRGQAERVAVDDGVDREDPTLVDQGDGARGHAHP